MGGLTFIGIGWTILGLLAVGYTNKADKIYGISKMSFFEKFAYTISGPFGYIGIPVGIFLVYDGWESLKRIYIEEGITEDDIFN